MALQTRWMDNDLYGHVNNVVFYSYFDTAVNKYLIDPGGLDIHAAPIIGIVAAIGLQGAGAALVPLNTRMKGGEAAYILNKSRAALLCTVGDFLGNRYVEMLHSEKLPELREIVALRGEVEGASGFESFLRRGDLLPRDRARELFLAVEPGDLSDIMFTSGTTGRPKGVMTTHAQNMQVYNVWSETVGLRCGDRYLVIGPFFHGFGYKAGWLAGLIRGATVYPLAVFDAEACMAQIARGSDADRPELREMKQYLAMK